MDAQRNKQFRDITRTIWNKKNYTEFIKAKLEKKRNEVKRKVKKKTTEDKRLNEAKVKEESDGSES